MVTSTQAFQGSDLAALPQGAALGLILQELRVIAYLLQQMNAGYTSDDQLDELREMVATEPRVVTTIVS